MWGEYTKVSANVSYKKGRVISIHDDYAYLNNFEARWGQEEFYENGKPYSRSNWYFHVFLILDGYVYDFSNQSTKPLLLKKYLKSYIPQGSTEKIFIQGILTQKTELKKYKKMKMHFYELSSYKEDTSGRYYSGYFQELFK